MRKITSLDEYPELNEINWEYIETLFVFENSDITQAMQRAFIDKYWFDRIAWKEEEVFWAALVRTYQNFSDTINKKMIKYGETLDETYGYYRDETINESGNLTGATNTSNATDYIDLPNRQSLVNYVSQKENSSGTNQTATTRQSATVLSRKGGVNVIDQRERMIKYYYNLAYELCDYFKDLFLKIYL